MAVAINQSGSRVVDYLKVILYCSFCVCVSSRAPPGCCLIGLFNPITHPGQERRLTQSRQQGAVLVIGTVVALIKGDTETAKVVFLRDLRCPVHRSLWIISQNKQHKGKRACRSCQNAQHVRALVLALRFRRKENTRQKLLVPADGKEADSERTALAAGGWGAPSRVPPSGLSSGIGVWRWSDT